MKKLHCENEKTCRKNSMYVTEGNIHRCHGSARLLGERHASQGPKASCKWVRMTGESISRQLL